MIYSRGDRRAGRAGRRDRHPGRRDAGGQGRAALRPSARRSARSARPARPAANRLARDADLVIGVGTRWSDFTTASKTAFQDPDVRFVNINVAGFDAAKHAALPARRPTRARRSRRCADALAGHRVDAGMVARAPPRSRPRGAREVARARRRRPRAAAQPGRGHRRRQRRRRAARRRRVRGRLAARRPAQAVARARPEGLPPRVRLLVHGLRDRGRHGRQAGRARARGVRDGRRRLVPDDAGRDRDRGAEGIKIVVVLVDNHGYASIGALSRSVGSAASARSTGA